MDIRPERVEDHVTVRALHAEAFAGRVPELVDALRTRDAALPTLSFVAVVDGTVAGHVMLNACWLDAPTRLVDVYVLSPLAVRPAYRRRGIGTRLVTHVLDAAGKVPLVFVEGPAAYYGVRGFEPARAAGFRRPSLRIPDPAFQVARLSGYAPWMTGTLVYCDAFWAYDCVGLR
jgi:putative acetyltransferase